MRITPAPCVELSISPQPLFWGIKNIILQIQIYILPHYIDEEVSICNI